MGGKVFISILLLVFSFFSWGKKEELTCSELHPIQFQYIIKHISGAALSKSLKKRTVNQLIKSLDRSKVYFIQPDVVQIKKWFAGLFQNIKEADCKPLEKLYNLFYQRVKERADFVKKEIARPGFKLDEKTSIILDSDKRSYAKNKTELNQFYKKYVQYELAGIMTTENNIEKSKKHLIGIYDRVLEKIYSWNPSPSAERLKYCINQEKENKRVKTCKYEKWYAFYLDSFAKALDPHSSYLSQYELDDFEINMKLSLEGIGASLSSKYGYTTIERLLPGGAAKRSGKIKKKDRIVAIGQSGNKLINIFGWDLRDVVEMVRGRKGTTVYLKILRTLKNGAVRKFVVKLKRRKIQLKDSGTSIFYSKKKLNGEEKVIGVIRVPSFYGGSSGGAMGSRSVSKDVRRLIQSAQNKNLAGLVLDLSGNGGGILNEAVKVVGLFIEKGNVVRQMTRDFDGRSVYHTLADRDENIDYIGPLVVLVDRSSASASEIVAGALKDYKRAVIVGGDHTFGKGSIQSVEHISRWLGATKTTVGLYFIPGGRSTQKTGVQSDVKLPSLISVDKFGEKNLDYVLPSQHTTAFLTRDNKEKKWNPLSSSLIKKIKMRSKLRVSKSKKFKKIKVDIAKFKEKIESKSEIKIKTLLAETKEQEKEQEEEEELFDLDVDHPKFKKKYLERASVDEAVQVAWDMYLMNHKMNTASKN